MYTLKLCHGISLFYDSRIEILYTCAYLSFMPAITSGDALLWLGSGIIGTITGVFGNWAVTGWFQYTEDKTCDKLKAALIPVGGLICIFLALIVCFFWVSSLP